LDLQLTKDSQLSKRYTPHDVYLERGRATWGMPWTMEQIRQLPEYPAVTLIAGYHKSPHPQLVITRVEETSIELYVVRDTPLTVWLMPMIHGIRNGVLYQVHIGDYQEHEVSSYQDGLALLPGFVLRAALCS
jgi:hypothetical protein